MVTSLQSRLREMKRPLPGTAPGLPPGCARRAEEFGSVLRARRTFLVGKPGDCPRHRDSVLALAWCVDENCETPLQPMRGVTVRTQVPPTHPAPRSRRGCDLQVLGDDALSHCAAEGR